MKPLVIYHGNCADGFTAAWLANMAFHFRAGNGLRPNDWVVDRHAARYGEAPPDVAGREVYILDFSYDFHILAGMARKAKSIVLIDHHATAIQALEKFSMPNVSLHLSDKRSGAYLTAEYFWPLMQPPEMVKLVDDRDRWVFSDSRTRPFHAKLFSRPYAIGEWNKLAENIAGHVQEGVAIEAHIQKQTDELVHAAMQHRLVRLPDGQRVLVPAANLPYVFASDAGAHMLILNPDAPFALTWYVRADGRAVVSFRSRNGGDVDVGAIAAHFGGGGHKHASGAVIDDISHLN